MHSVLKPAQCMEWPGFALVAGGALLFAFFKILIGRLIKKKEKGGMELPSDIVVTVYSLSSGLLFLAASFLFDPPKIWSVFDAQLGIFWPLLATCVLNIFVQFGSTRAQKYADTALVSSVGAFQPFISLLPAWLVLRETPNSYGYAGLFVIVAGIYVMSLAKKIEDPAKVPSWGKTADGRLRFTAPLAVMFTNKGVQLAFLATACGSVSVNFDKKATMLSSCLFAPGVISLFVGLLGLIKLKRVDWQKVKKSHLCWLFVAGALYFCLNALYFYAFRYGLAIYVSALKRLHVIFILPLSYFILKEEITKDRKYWLGVLIFVAGLFFFTIP